MTARSDFLERAPLDDPYIQAAIPPIARPDRTMVLMTGDAPMGFIATQLPPQIPVLRVDGWMVQPRDGTQITRDMKARVSRQLREGGDLYLIADATDMGRARDALNDYDLAIRWTECQQFDTNLVGDLSMVPACEKIMIPRIAVLVPCYNEEAAIAHGGARFPRARCPGAVIYVYDNNSSRPDRRAGARGRRDGAPGSAPGQGQCGAPHVRRYRRRHLCAGGWRRYL